jgi:TatD DNase family protein
MKHFIIDTHSHLYAEEFINDSADVISRAKASGIKKIILPNIDLTTVDSMLSLTKENIELFFPALGLHPSSVNSNYKQDLQLLEKYFFEENFFAIGETGIDLYWDKTFQSEQMDSFMVQLGWAKNKKLPIIIHTRKSFEQVFSCVKKFKGEVSGIFHCFSGSHEEAERIISLGNFKMGLGGVLTFKNSGLASVVEKIDLEHFVLETDAPYLSPTPHRGKRNEPSYIVEVVKKLAEIKKCSVGEVVEITTKNAESIFSLN